MGGLWGTTGTSPCVKLVIVQEYSDKSQYRSIGRPGPALGVEGCRNVENLQVMVNGHTDPQSNYSELGVGD